MLKEKIADPRILDLIRGILKAGFQEVDKPWQPSPEGTPQGGPLSPLLANVYLHYTLDVKFQKLTKQNAGESKLLRYADDFVILSRTKAQLIAIRRCLSVWIREAGLSLKESKTRTINMQNRYRSHRSRFVFLGYKIHLRAFRDNPKRFWVARQPSEKARKSLREALKAKLVPNLSPPQTRQLAKAIWTGWSNYFRYGNSNRVFYREVKSVKRAVWRYLRRKYRSQRRPVPWRRLIPLGLWITRGIRPARVIPDSLRQSRRQSKFGFA
jgi:RNA-directed DNA polymerase